MKQVKTFLAITATFISTSFSSCNNDATSEKTATEEHASKAEVADYFLLRPEVEKAFGYAHAVSHAGSSTNEQSAKSTALTFSYMLKKLI